MKILFFILGSIENRINAWGINGFKSILEQDIVFYGPIPENKFMYNGKEIPIISILHETNVNELFSMFPPNWYPEIITCETSVINLIPDIYKCPVKTYLLARDAWVDTMYNKGILELFDFIRYNVVDRQSYQGFKTNFLPLSGTAVSIPSPLLEDKEYKTRKIDVIAIASYNNSFYHLRYKLLYSLAKNANKRLKIVFINTIKFTEIHQHYRQAKIIVDWAHTLSNRSYEAALNGCLLFSHEDNKLIEEFWTPWEEYIPFNNSNLLELLEYYLNHTEISEKIIENSLIKSNTIPTSFGDSILSHLYQALESNHQPSDRIKYLESINQTTLLHRLATPLYFNYHFPQYNIPNNWEHLYFQRINKALAANNNEDVQVIIPPLIEASRMAFLLKKHELALEYITKLKLICPNYAWTYYLYGRILFDANEHNLAEENYVRAIECGTKHPELLKKFILPFTETKNVCDKRRVTDYLWQSSYNHNNEYQLKALNNLCYSALGDLFLIKNDKNKATEQFSMANSVLPIPTSVYKVCELYLNTKQYIELLKASNTGLDDSPYDYKLFIFKTIALLKLNRKKEARSILKDEINILKCFERNKVAEKLSLIYKLLVISLYFEKQLSIWVFLALLKKL